MTDTTHRLALVTGASRGIGRALALALAKQNYHVIATARVQSQGALEALDDDIRDLGGQATLVPFDLKNGDAIDNLSAQLYTRFGRLDALAINAAQLGPITPLTHLDVKAYESVMRTNVDATWRLLRGLNPLLEASDAGRVVLLSSGAAHKHRPFWGLYGASKAAAEHLALTYAAETAHKAIRCNVVNPGATRTAMRADAVPGEDPSTLPDPDGVADMIAGLLSAEETRTGEVLSYYDHAGITRD